MLRIRLAASGEEVVALDTGGFEALVMQHGSTVKALKIYLAQEHFQKKFSRYQLRILREGDSTALKDEERINPPLDLQLVLMSHLPPDVERDWCFFLSCQDGEEDELQKSLQALQNPVCRLVLRLRDARLLRPSDERRVCRLRRSGCGCEVAREGWRAKGCLEQGWQHCSSTCKAEWLQSAETLRVSYKMTSVAGCPEM